MSPTSSIAPDEVTCYKTSSSSSSSSSYLFFQIQYSTKLKTSDVNKDWTHKDQDKDKDQSHKDKDKD